MEKATKQIEKLVQEVKSEIDIGKKEVAKKYTELENDLSKN